MRVHYRRVNFSFFLYYRVYPKLEKFNKPKSINATAFRTTKLFGNFLKLFVILYFSIDSDCDYLEWVIRRKFKRERRQQSDVISKLEKIEIINE